MASRIKGITVEIGGDTTKLDQALKTVNNTIKTTQSELKDVSRLLKLDPSNTELLSQKQRALKDAVTATKEKLDALKNAQEQAKKQLEEGKLGQDKYDALQREIVETEQELQRLQREAANTNTALAKIEAIGGKMQKVGDSIAGAGKKMMPVTLAIAGVGAAAVKTTAEFDEGMSRVSAISGATGDELQTLRDKAREMGAKTKFSASEAASAFEYMAMAGWKSGEMIDGIDGIMSLAAASGEDLAVASDIVTDALTAFGLKASDAGHFSDILAAASSNANTNVSMMGETFKYCAPIAGALGFSAEDTAQAIGLMANSGIKGSQAGTSLRTVMNNLSSDIKLTGKALGEVTIHTTNADGSMRGLSDILADCRAAFSKLSESEKAHAAEALVGKNAMSGFLALMNAAPADIDKLSNAIGNCDGTSERMAATMQDNLSGQLTILKSQLQELAISFGEILMPVIRSIVSKIQEFTDRLNGMDEGTKKNIVRIAALVAAIGPLLIVIGTTISKVGAAMQGFSTLAKGIGNLKLAMTSGTGILGKLGAAIGGLSAPIIAVVAVIAVLVAAFIHLWNNNEEFRNKVIAIWEQVKAAFVKFGDAIKTRLAALGISFKDIVDFIKTIWDGFCNLLAPVFEGAFAAIAAVLEGVLDILVGLFDVFAGLFTGNWGQVWNGLKEIFKGTWDGILGILKAAVDMLVGIVDVFLGWFGTDWKTVWSGIKSFFIGIWDGIVGFFSGVWNGIKNTVSTAVNAVKTVITTVFTAISTFFSNVWNGMKTTVSTVWNGIKSTITTVVNAVKTVITTVWTSIKTTVSTVLGGIKSTVESVWNGIKSTIGGVMNGIKTSISSVWSGIKSTVSGAVNSVKNVVTTAFNAIKSTATTVWNGIKTAITTPINSAKSVISGAIDKIKGLFKFNWSFPKLKMPHFSWTWKDVGGIVKLPNISIQWYKKAMDGGMILNKPTIFGAKNGSLLGAGEAGSETVVGTRSLMEMIRRAVAGMKTSPNINYGGVTINVYGREGQDISALADEIEERINLGVARRNAAFA